MSRIRIVPDSAVSPFFRVKVIVFARFSAVTRQADDESDRYRDRAHAASSKNSVLGDANNSLVHCTNRRE
jgi:hypothetical protein